jgi:hypothetical protein
VALAAASRGSSCLWMVIQCRKYPGITIGLGRKELSNLGKTTARTLLGEVHPVLGVKAANFKYVAPGTVSPGVYYQNGSTIQFIDLAPTDPNFDRFGSLPLTHVVIEEAGELVHKARAVITSRRDRKLNRQYGITGKAVLTCNPSPNFVREEFYEPYVALGGGDVRTWEFANDQGDPIYAEVGGTTVRARRAFVRSLPTDNPFLSDNYIQNLKSLPAAERRCLLKGDWDFDDDETTLFKLHLIHDVADLSGEMLGGGAAEPDGEGDVVAAAAEPDQPDLSGGSAAAAGRAVVDFDLQGVVGVGVAVAVRGGATGGSAVDPGPAAGVAGHGVEAAGPGAKLFVA